MSKNNVSSFANDTKGVVGAISSGLSSNLFDTLTTMLDYDTPLSCSANLAVRKICKEDLMNNQNLVVNLQW